MPTIKINKKDIERQIQMIVDRRIPMRIYTDINIVNRNANLDEFDLDKYDLFDPFYTDR
jgi:hypothetical protein